MDPPAKLEDFLESQIHHQLAWTAPKVAGQRWLIKGRVWIEQTVRGLNQSRLRRIGGDAGPRIKQGSAIEITANRNVERRTGLNNDERTQTDIPLRVDRAVEGDAMAHIGGGWPILAREIVRSCRKRSKAICVAACVIQNV